MLTFFLSKLSDVQLWEVETKGPAEKDEEFILKKRNPVNDWHRRQQDTIQQKIVNSGKKKKKEVITWK